MYRIGFDVGGTFTDFTVLNEETTEIHFHKVPSTPADPSEAIQRGVAELIGQLEITGPDISFVGHGTTVATNMIIERRGSPTALITTKGFRDVLEIGRQVRPALFDYTVNRPPPLCSRDNRHEVTERICADGSIEQPIDDAEIADIIEHINSTGIEAVAVCFLHSYRRAEHERQVGNVLKHAMPNAYISLSSNVLPEFREYERLSTTVLNAYVGPKMAIYLERFLVRMTKLGIEVNPFTIHSNGGLMSVETVKVYPVRTCLSGPAAGVIGAVEVARVAGFPNILTYDVGGTSTDVSMIHGLKARFTSDRTVADYPVRAPMLDIHVIGAGGGSIAWMDDAGAVKVGPESAGADPGPVAYDRGGDRPTITDANICLHRLNPIAILDGRMPVNKRKAAKAIMAQIGEPLGLSLEEAAYGILQIAIANMSRAIRSVSTERGYDIAEFALMPFGGAGPLHAAEIAKECGIPKILVPCQPGTMCARGILLSDLSFDFVRSEITEAGENSWGHVQSLFDDMQQQGRDWLIEEGVNERNRKFRYMIDARYRGQNYEIRIELSQINAGGLPEFLYKFNRIHNQEYGYNIPDRPVEIVNCRLQAIGRVPKAFQKKMATGGSLAEAFKESRRVYFGLEDEWVETPVYSREQMPDGESINGPAIINEMSSTTVIHPGQTADIDTHGNIIIDIGL